MRAATGFGRGITMLRLMQLRFAAVALFAAAAVSLTAASAFAFTQQMIQPDAGNYSFTEPNDQTKNSNQGAHPFGSNGPTVQFGIQQGPVAPFGGSQSNGYKG